ncbi:phage tail tape measure protein, partial [Pseudomonas sp. AFG_SD02_1510_Pfu_092]
GGLGGESVGGWLGKKLFGEDQPEQVAAELPVVGAAVAQVPQPSEPMAKPSPALGDAVRAKPAPAVEASAPVGQPAAEPGAVVRALVNESPAPAAVAPAVAKAAEKAKPEPAKVDQSFTFAPVMPITVNGDVKDPNQVVREAEQALRVMFEGFQREVAARQASVNLFDAADVA